MEQTPTISSEEKILKKALLFLGFLSLSGTMMFMGLAKRSELSISEAFTLGIFTLGLITTLVCFVSYFLNVLRFTAIILLSIFISTIGSFQQMNISLLFIIPVFLGYCFQSKRKSYAIMYLNIVFFNVSRIFRSYNIYISNPRIYVFKNILLSNVIIALFESIIFLSIALPIFMLLVKQNAKLKQALQEKNEATNDILQFCSTATSFHNKYLSVHIKGVRDITRIILDALINAGVYIEPNYYKQIIFSVQFHDIGKIYIDSSILDKKGSLNPDEFNLIKEHPARGLELFSLLPKNVLDEKYIEITKNVIYQHHERMDGSGYPTGTKDISFEAKIVAIADVVDALLSWRPYKPPLSWDSMIEILERQKDGYSYECIKMVYQEKEKIMAVSNANNQTLKELLYLSDEEIVRK